MKENYIIRFFNRFMKPIIKQQIIAFLCLITFTVLNVSFPYFLKLIIDDALQKKNLKLLGIYGITMILVAVGMILFNYLQRMKFIKIGQNVTFNIKKCIFNNLMNSSYDFYSQHDTGEITSILEEDVNSIQDLSTRFISDLLISFFTCIGLFAILFFMDKHIALATLGLILIFAFIQNKLGKIIRNKTLDFRKKIAAMYSKTYEIISGIKFIQILNCEEIFKKIYFEKQEKCIKSNINFFSTQIYSSSVGAAFSSLGIILVLILGGIKVLDNEMTVGALFTLTIYVQRVYSPIIKLGNTYITVQKSKVILKRIFKLIDNTNLVDEGSITSNDELKGNIIFNNVCFKYKSNKILNNVNFQIKSGDMIGIVGENGCGKTSLIRLLTRLCDANSGQILLDKINIKDFKLSYLRNQIGYMTQKVFIFNDSIKNNLTMYNNNISEETLNKVIEGVCLKKDIQNMPNGINTILESNGTNLSGGQAQKIGLARILLKNPSIIILDEPTSALDIKVEKFLSNNLNKLLKNKTVIIISHRREILKICSKIFKIHNYQINEINEFKNISA